MSQCPQGACTGHGVMNLLILLSPALFCFVGSPVGKRTVEQAGTRRSLGMVRCKSRSSRVRLGRDSPAKRT